MKKRLTAMLGMAVLGLLLVGGCSESEPRGSMEEAGAEMDRAADRMEDAAEDAADAMEDAAEHAGDAMEDAADAVGDAAQEAGEAVRDATR